LFRANTVFIVGAGASEELGFPLGGRLLKDIAERVDISYDFGRLARGDHVLANALRNRLNAGQDVRSYNEHLHSAWQLVRSSKQGLSIDNVLDALEDPRAALVGKFGIVRSILCSEEKSPLSKWIDHFPKDINISALSGTWLDHLSRLLTEGRRKSEIQSIFENLTIINFNYDRSIEHYLPFSLAEYYGLSPGDIREVMPTLSILRPYGKAGSLPWEAGEQQVEFGDSGAGAVEKAAQRILTFTEQVQDKALLGEIKQALENAERVVFLGFGFHRQNLKILECAALPSAEVLATSFGVSKSDSASIKSEVEIAFELSTHNVINHEYVRLLPLKCGELMSEVWRTLTSEPGTDPRIEFPTMPAFEMPAIAGLR
jgi:hypothetical protein